MHMCPRYLWVTWLSVSLVLVLSSCSAHEGKTAPPSPPVPQTPAPPSPSPSALRVGIAPNYPPLAFRAVPSWICYIYPQWANHPLAS